MRKLQWIWIPVMMFTATACDKERVNEDPDIAFGRELFNDTKFSGDGSLSCASCHPGGDMDHKKWLLPVFPESIATPTLFGVSDTPPYLWTSGFSRIDSLTKAVITVIMGGSVTDAELKALTAYQMSLTVPANPWRNEGGSLTEAQARGKFIFENQGGCNACHSGYSFSGADTVQVEAAQPKMNIPSLRWVFATAPYFHRNNYQTLRDVVDHYADGVTTLQMKSWKWNDLGGAGRKTTRNIYDIDLTEQEKDDLVEYLKTL